MFELVWPVVCPPWQFFTRVVLVLAVLLLPACAKSPSHVPAQPWKISVAPPASHEGWQTVRVEIEDDGIEAQSAPPRRLSNEPDDPMEPFSPNYGSVRPARGEAALHDPIDTYEPEAANDVIGLRDEAVRETRG